MHANQTYHWQNFNNQRYYIARLEKDLLDDWIVVRIFGGVYSQKILRTYCASEEEGIALLEKIHNTRILPSHGYQPVKSVTL